MQYDGTYEDLFFYVERLIVAQCGEDVAGRLHTARSRNDIDMTMYRMRQREMVLALTDGTVGLRRTLLDLAARHTEDVFPAHTHTQPAQPTTIAHYLMAVVEQLERDTVRLRAAYAVTNQNPLGACAITGTGFPIDRCRTTALLGFDGSTGNTYGSIATVDYLLESVSAASVLLVGLGRVVQDLLLWCTTEVGYLRLSDGFVQCSSIMPQKRNPVALEHARAIASKAVGQAAAVVLAVHNTPVRRHRRHGRRSAAARLVDVPRRRPGHTSGRRGDERRRVQHGADGRARGRGLDHRHRAGRHAGARARRAFQIRPQHRVPSGVAGRQAGSRPAVGRPARGVAGSPGKERRDGRRVPGARAEPAAFRRGAEDARWSGAERDGARDCRIAAAPG